jgi:anti-sigma factor RsiW
MTELNDELLVAYVDGQLAKDQSKAIERVLEEDEVAAQRVAALRAANSHLETAFEAMLAGEPIPVPTEDAETSERAARRGFFATLRRSIAFVWVGTGCLIGGAAAGFVLHDRIAADPFQTVPPQVAPAKAPPTPVSITPAVGAPVTWADDMVRTHALLSPETFTFGLQSEGNMELTSFQLSKTLGTDLMVPDLSDNKLVFQRAQVMQRDGKPFAQIAYMAETGSPVALYATLRSGEASAMTEGDKDGIGYVAWAQGELSLLLAGDLPDADLRGLANFIQSRFAEDEPKVQDTGAPVPVPLPAEVGQAEDAAQPEAASSEGAQ